MRLWRGLSSDQLVGKLKDGRVDLAFAFYNLLYFLVVLFKFLADSFANPCGVQSALQPRLFNFRVKLQQSALHLFALLIDPASLQFRLGNHLLILLEVFFEPGAFELALSLWLIDAKLLEVRDEPISLPDSLICHLIVFFDSLNRNLPNINQLILNRVNFGRPKLQYFPLRAIRLLI